MPTIKTRYIFRNINDKFKTYSVDATSYEDAFKSLKENTKKPYLYCFEGCKKIIVCY